MSRGHDRERQVKAVLESEDWVVVRAAGSLGPIDLVAMREGSRTRVVEVKSTLTPYSHFLPKDRADMLAIARLAGADPVLAWWPSRGKLRWITPNEWPALRAA